MCQAQGPTVCQAEGPAQTPMENWSRAASEVTAFLLAPETHNCLKILECLTSIEKSDIQLHYTKATLKH